MKSMIDMPEEARVWFYQANRVLTDQEIDHVAEEMTASMQDWSSHGSKMDASFEILFSRVIAVAADEGRAVASGCGIDKSVRFVQSLGEKMNIDFFTRTQVLYFQGDEVKDASLHQFWGLRKALIINDDTVVLDTTVRTVGELRKSLKKPFSASWHAEMWGR
jgi:hypothetical protein